MKLYKTKIKQPVKPNGKTIYYEEQVCVTETIDNFDIPVYKPALVIFDLEGNRIEGTYRFVSNVFYNTKSNKLKKALLKEYAEYLI